MKKKSLRRLTSSTSFSTQGAPHFQVHASSIALVQNGVTPVAWRNSGQRVKLRSTLLASVAIGLIVSAIAPQRALAQACGPLVAGSATCTPAGNPYAGG